MKEHIIGHKDEIQNELKGLANSDKVATVRKYNNGGKYYVALYDDVFKYDNESERDEAFEKITDAIHLLMN